MSQPRKPRIDFGLLVAGLFVVVGIFFVVYAYWGGEALEMPEIGQASESAVP